MLTLCLLRGVCVGFLLIVYICEAMGLERGALTVSSINTIAEGHAVLVALRSGMYYVIDRD